MSGIINSAGSRSGIIGETELDYEIGEWTPALANPSGASFSADTGEYVYAAFAESPFVTSKGIPTTAR